MFISSFQTLFINQKTNKLKRKSDREVEEAKTKLNLPGALQNTRQAQYLIFTQLKREIKYNRAYINNLQCNSQSMGKKVTCST